MPFISVTRLRVRSWTCLPAFLIAAWRSARQAKAADGNLFVRVLGDQRNAYWTLTSWESEAAMRQFMRAKPHGPIMKNLINWCDEAALVHWNQADTEPPSWEEAHQRMQHEGRPSKVNHPSAAQTKYTIAAPVTSARGELRFK